MASATKVFVARNRMKRRKAGKRRKKLITREGTTPTKEEFFNGKKAEG